MFDVGTIRAAVSKPSMWGKPTIEKKSLGDSKLCLGGRGFSTDRSSRDRLT